MRIELDSNSLKLGLEREILTQTDFDTLVRCMQAFVDAIVTCRIEVDKKDEVRSAGH